MKQLTLKAMKTSLYKSLFLVAILLLGFSAINAQEINKEYHKEYSVQDGDLLELDNRYGDVIVTTGNTDKVVVHVVVSLTMPNRSDAEKMISYININFLEESGKYGVKTTIDNRFSFSGWGRTNKRFNIKYTVSVPSWINLTVKNRYGNVDLGKLDGRLMADIQYGDLKTLELTRGNVKPVNIVNISYGKVDILEAGWLDFTGRYAPEILITKAQAVAFDTKYSKVTVSDASSLVVESRYDKYNLGSVNNIVVNAGYSDFDLISVSKRLMLECRYGSFRVGSVPAGFELIDIDTDYTGVSAIIDESAGYEIVAKVSYGKIEVNENAFSRQRQIIGNTSVELEGVINPQSSSPIGKVFVEASYGNVKLY